MTKKQPLPPQDFYSVSARAGATQLFGSGQAAFRKDQDVVLEFTPQMVVVHSATQASPCNFTKLGIILYTYVFSPHQSKYNVKTARKTGAVSDKMAFAMRHIEHTTKGSDCLFCGRHWKKLPTGQAVQDHLRSH